VTFGYLWTLYVHVCGINDFGHTSNEWLVFVSKIGYDSSAIISVTRHHRHQHDSAATSYHGQITLAAPPPAWLNSDITPWPSHLGSTVASMTQQQHRAMAKSPWQHPCQHDSVAQSPARLGSDIAPQPNCLNSAIVGMTWQHRHQHDSTVTSRHDQHLLGSTITSMTRQRRHTTSWLSNSTTT
jgi:hypothetical protein